MTELLDEVRSIEIATPIKSKAKTCFENACKAALAIEGALYVQGFVAVPGAPYKPIDNLTLKQYNDRPKSEQIRSPAHDICRDTTLPCP